MKSLVKIGNKGVADIASTIMMASLVITIIWVFLKPVSSAVFTPYGSQKIESKSVDAVIEILNQAPAKAYIEIGEIKAYCSITDQQTIDKIIVKAREIGADAVIIKERNKEYFLAIAVKYKA